MPKYYTNQLRCDGFGAQYHSLIYAILYAEVYCRGEFVYTKPNLVNVYNDKADEYEEIMNLSKSFKSINEIKNKNNVTVIDIQRAISIIEPNLQMYLQTDTMKKIKFLFRQNKDLNILDDNYYHIAIHIRRPSLHPNIDLSDEHKEGWNKNMNIEQLIQISPRFTNDQYFIDIINNIRNTSYSKKKIFHIFSEGNQDNFKFKNENDIIFHLNGSVKDAFIYMVMSNILVISRSSFSVSAALLTDNIVFNMNNYLRV